MLSDCQSTPGQASGHPVPDAVGSGCRTSNSVPAHDVPR